MKALSCTSNWPAKYDGKSVSVTPAISNIKGRTTADPRQPWVTRCRATSTAEVPDHHQAFPDLLQEKPMAEVQPAPRPQLLSDSCFPLYLAEQLLKAGPSMSSSPYKPLLLHPHLHIPTVTALIPSQPSAAVKSLLK